MSKAFFTTAEIAKLFDVYPSTVADWIDSGQLEAFRTAGGHRRVRPRNLRVFLKEMKMKLPDELQEEKTSVLIIDDDDDTVKLTSEGLEERQFKVESASSGFEGMFKIGRMRPDVVVVDLMMPGMDGAEVCEEIKTNEELASICVIVVTGFAGNDLRERIMSKGADAFFQKPVDVDELAQTIHKLTSEEAEHSSRTRK